MFASCYTTEWNFRHALPRQEPMRLDTAHSFHEYYTLICKGTYNREIITWNPIITGNSEDDRETNIPSLFYIS
jgi:hypothetical protein